MDFFLNVHSQRSYFKQFFFSTLRVQDDVYILIKQLVVNSKKIGGSAAGKQNGLKKTEARLFLFEYSIK